MSNSDDTRGNIFKFGGRTCTPASESLSYNYANASPITGTVTLHTLLTIIGAPITVLTALLGIFIATKHLLNYTNPQIQRQLIRIVLTPLCFSVTSFFAVWFYEASEYLIPIGHLYEAVALVAFFYYMLVVACPAESERVAFFAQLQRKGKSGEVVPDGSLIWYSARSLRVLQLVPVRLITMVLTWIIAASVCPTARASTLGLTIINVINTIATIICLISLLQTYSSLKAYFPPPHHVLTKFVSLKIVVFVTVVQRLVFTILVEQAALTGSEFFSFLDWSQGIPQLLVVVEMLLFSFLFLYSFGWAAFQVGGSGDGKGRLVTGEAWGVGKAMGNVIDIRDVLRGFGDARSVRQIARDREAGNGTYKMVGVDRMEGAGREFRGDIPPTYQRNVRNGGVV